MPTKSTKKELAATIEGLTGRIAECVKRLGNTHAASLAESFENNLNTMQDLARQALKKGKAPAARIVLDALIANLEKFEQTFDELQRPRRLVIGVIDPQHPRRLVIGGPLKEAN